MFSLNLHLSFLVLTTKLFLVLHFVVQFSEFFIRGALTHAHPITLILIDLTNPTVYSFQEWMSLKT
jgi:hypothetical protein